MAYKTYPGAHPSIRINVLKRLPLERYKLALKRKRAQIAKGLPLRAFDDDTPGNKDMGCSWGMCDDTPRLYPDAEDHTFPVDFEKEGRCSALQPPEGQKCPLDRRLLGDLNLGVQGCFYTCRVFMPRKGDEPMTQEFALKLYDAGLSRLNPPKAPK